MSNIEEPDSVKGSSDTQQEETADRRKLLKSLLTGSAVVTGSTGLPQTWTRPLTNVIILPAHASLSACEARCFAAGGKWDPDSDFCGGSGKCRNIGGYYGGKFCCPEPDETSEDY